MLMQTPPLWYVEDAHPARMAKDYEDPSKMVPDADPSRMVHGSRRSVTVQGACRFLSDSQ